MLYKFNIVAAVGLEPTRPFRSKGLLLVLGLNQSTSVVPILPVSNFLTSVYSAN